MHYLILTPDGVGSTILQRLLTMALHLEGEKVTNTHELTSGLGFANGVVVKNASVGYSQSLSEIEKILENSDSKIKIVSRVAKYHLNNRNDNEKHKESFYKFLNNFYGKKIKCVRENIFEYAMSWSIRNESEVLNVYTQEDRIKVAAVSEVNEQYFLRKCKEYVEYQNWIEKHFPDIETMSYEDLLSDGDKVIANMIGYEGTFEKHFGISLDCILKSEYDYLRGSKQSLSRQEQKGLILYKQRGNEMKDQKIITSSMPMKNTTLSDKKMQIKNFDNCLAIFYKFAKQHNWIDQSKATYDFWNGKNVN